MRSETTKDKAGALPPAVYAKQRPDAAARVCFPSDQAEQALPASTASPMTPSEVSLSFVSNNNIPQVTLTSAADFNQVEEYQSHSDDSDSDVDADSEEMIISTCKPFLTRSGRQVKVFDA